MFYGTLPPRAQQLQAALNDAYEQAANPTLSPMELRRLERKISEMECELDEILQNQGQALTPGGYYTSEGVKRASGTVVAQPALVLATEQQDKKRNPVPFIALALVAAGTAYFTIRG